MKLFETFSLKFRWNFIWFAFFSNFGTLPRGFGMEWCPRKKGVTQPCSLLFFVIYHLFFRYGKWPLFIVWIFATVGHLFLSYDFESKPHRTVLSNNSFKFLSELSLCPKMNKHVAFFAQKNIMKGTGFLVWRNILRVRVVASCRKRDDADII